jgi:hypothetical protein
VHIYRGNGPHIYARPENCPDLVSNMASRQLNRWLWRRVLTPSVLLQAGILSLVALVVVTGASASNDRHVDPRHWLALWAVGFVVVIVGAALVRLPALLRDRRDHS